MKNYPASELSFKIGTKKYNIKMLTLGLQARIEDENTEVTFRDIVEGCTNMPNDVIDTLHLDQFKAIYDDIIAFTYIEPEGGGEPKKP